MRAETAIDGGVIEALVDRTGALQHTESVETVFEAVGGVPRLVRLAAAWHERVMADEIVSHAFSHGFQDEHTERLAAYWAEALGGPAVYSETMGNELPHDAL